MTETALRVAVLDYEAGNVRSARRAFTAAGADAFITGDADTAAGADALVVPGVGHFDSCLAYLRKAGLEHLIRTWINDQRPLFGICVGMQLLYEDSDEGAQAGLGLLPGRVVRFASDVVVPHLGWDIVRGVADDELVAAVDRRHTYFTHSYYAVPEDDTHVLGRCTYGGEDFPCLVREGSVVGTQFHPEKSGQVGQRLLQRWVASLSAS